MIYFVSTLLLVIIWYLYSIGKTLNSLLSLNIGQVSDNYKEAVQEQKTKKPPLKAVKQKLRGRSIVKSDDLIDVADLPWEEGYKAMEDIGV